jgi:hypothetical protein
MALSCEEGNSFQMHKNILQLDRHCHLPSLSQRDFYRGMLEWTFTASLTIVKRHIMHIINGKFSLFFTKCTANHRSSKEIEDYASSFDHPLLPANGLVLDSRTLNMVIDYYRWDVIDSGSEQNPDSRARTTLRECD